MQEATTLLDTIKYIVDGAKDTIIYNPPAPLINQAEQKDILFWGLTKADLVKSIAVPFLTFFGGVFVGVINEKRKKYNRLIEIRDYISAWTERIEKTLYKNLKTLNDCKEVVESNKWISSINSKIKHPPTEEINELDKVEVSSAFTHSYNLKQNSAGLYRRYFMLINIIEEEIHSIVNNLNTHLFAYDSDLNTVGGRFHDFYKLFDITQNEYIKSKAGMDYDELFKEIFTNPEFIIQIKNTNQYYESNPFDSNTREGEMQWRVKSHCDSFLQAYNNYNVEKSRVLKYLNDEIDLNDNTARAIAKMQVAISLIKIRRYGYLGKLRYIIVQQIEGIRYDVTFDNAISHVDAIADERPETYKFF